MPKEKFHAVLTIETPSNRGACSIFIERDETEHVLVIIEEKGSSGEGVHKDLLSIMYTLFEAHGALDPSKLRAFYRSSSGAEFKIIFEDVCASEFALLGGVSKLVPIEGTLPAEGLAE